MEALTFSQKDRKSAQVLLPANYTARCVSIALVKFPSDVAACVEA